MLKARFGLYAPALDSAVTLKDMINPYGKKSKSSEALKLIDRIKPEELNTTCELVTKMAFVECELEENVQRTLGTQCLIYLFDPGNGWIRDYTKRCDMLLMTAKLVEKGSSLEGLYYYRGNPVIKDQSFKQIVQNLIDRSVSDPSSKLTAEIIEIFTKAGYDFSYPSSDNTSSLRV